jgi:hypothetical protein
MFIDINIMGAFFIYFRAHNQLLSSSAG